MAIRLFNSFNVFNLLTIIASMNNVRLGVIGMGYIGQHHAEYLAAGRVRGAELRAVARTAPGKFQQLKGLKVFGSGEELIRSKSVDAVLIATPHYQHAALGVEALAAGLHVMVEKPIAAHKADAERLIAVHEKHPELAFAAMFQFRVEPRYRKIRELLTSGQLGKIVRVSWTVTDWFRTEAYYAGGGWRGTWKGEGGGVLLNQCPHNLDILYWLAGAPALVRGFCQLGRYHDIEVEDSVTAYLEYPDGATGTFVASTGEAPGTNRLEIAGTFGKLVLEADKLSLTRNAQDMAEFSLTAKVGFAKPETTHEEILVGNASEPRAAVTQNFVNAIRNGEPLVAPGAEGLHSLELANAILYSSLTNQTVRLPLDGASYESRLNELATQSTA
jgi:predicted dehydrogenase